METAKIKRALRNQAVLAEQAARKLWEYRPADWPRPENEDQLREQVEKIAANPSEYGAPELSKSESKALTRMSTLHRWEQTANEERAKEAAADARVEEQAKQNGLEKLEYLVMVHLMTAKAQGQLTDKGMEELRRILDKSDAYLREQDREASAEIAAMRAEMVKERDG